AWKGSAPADSQCDNALRCGGPLRSSAYARVSITPAQATRDAGLLSACRAGVLVEWLPRPGVKPDRYVLAFAHHMLYDAASPACSFGGRTSGWSNGARSSQTWHLPFGRACQSVA